MGFIKNLFNPRWIFDILQSGSNDFKTLCQKIKAWIYFDLQTIIVFGICFLFKCMAPSEGEGKCIGSYDNGIDNVYTLKASSITTAGGSDINEGIYKGVGQSMPWIDTGFETTGEQLIVYANGDYFPWGKAATERTTTYHPVTTKVGDTDEWETTLQLSEDYQECELNTDTQYTQYDAQIVREYYENHLNKYTDVNPNNKGGGFAQVLLDGSVSATHIQADCINHNNCNVNPAGDQNPIGCVLRRGAGIYMKFGENMPFGYHIINHDIPQLRQVCNDGCKCDYQRVTNTVTGKQEWKKNCDPSCVCEYKYINLGSNAIKTIRIPFTLPIMFYRREGMEEDIRDTQEEVNGKLIDHKLYDGRDPKYEFTILDAYGSGRCPATISNPKLQEINGQCYESVTRTMTASEIANYSCKKETVNDEKHPDEFCPPPKGQRIYVKFADTFYEDDEGSVDLIFASGAKNLSPKFKYEINGFKLSWIQYIPYKLVAPFWGDQTKEDKPSELLDYKIYSDKIEITNKNGDPIYPTTYNKSHFVKTTRFGDRGIRLCGNAITSNGECKIPSTNVLITQFQNVDGYNHTITFKPVNSSVSLSDIDHDEIEPNIDTWLIKIDRLNEGLFFKIRDAILVNPFFTFAKIFFALWFVFSFGIGFLNKTKMLVLPTYTKDWKHFLILMWATDPDNYALIDDLLWPALFRYAEKFAAGILEIGTTIYGSSLHYENPFEFFDESIQMMTSKQLIYKISSLANDIVYWPVYLGWLPLLGTGIIRYIKTVVSWIWSLFLVLMDLGQIIMLFPFYAIISFFKSHEGVFKKTLIRILHSFTHLAFEMGFFCLLMGFVYKAFLEAIDVNICWRVKYSFKLFWIFPTTQLYAWVIDGINSVFAAYKEIFGGLLLGVLKFFFLSFITDWGSKIAKIAADTLMPDNMARSIGHFDDEIGKPLGQMFSSTMGAIGDKVDLNNNGKNGKGGDGKNKKGDWKGGDVLYGNGESVPRSNNIPENDELLQENNIPMNENMQQPSNTNIQQPVGNAGMKLSGGGAMPSRQGGSGGTGNAGKGQSIPTGDTGGNIGKTSGSSRPMNANGSSVERGQMSQGGVAKPGVERVEAVIPDGGVSASKGKSKIQSHKKESVLKQHDAKRKAKAKEDVQKELKNKLKGQPQPKNGTKGGIDNSRQQLTGSNSKPMENTIAMQANERIRKMERVSKINEKDRQINVIQEGGGTKTIEKNTYIHESNAGSQGINVNNNNVKPQANVIINGKSVPIGTKVQIGNVVIDTGKVMKQVQQVQQVNQAVTKAIAQQGVGKFNKTQLEQAIRQNLSTQMQQNVNQEMRKNTDNQAKVNNDSMNKLKGDFEVYKSGKISEKQFSKSMNKIHDEILLEKRTPIENMPEGRVKANELKQLSREEGIRDIEKGLAEGSISLDKANNGLSKMLKEEKIDNIKEQISTMPEGDLKTKLIQDVQRMEEKMDLSDKLSKGEINKEQ